MGLGFDEAVVDLVRVRVRYRVRFRVRVGVRVKALGSGFALDGRVHAQRLARREQPLEGVVLRAVAHHAAERLVRAKGEG